MYSVKYTKKSLDCLKLFIQSYKNSFIKLINDSGLIVEDILVQNYINIWDRFYENIINKLESILKEERAVLWRLVKENNKTYIIIWINNFKLYVYYEEKIDLCERYIKNIEFFRK